MVISVGVSACDGRWPAQSGQGECVHDAALYQAQVCAGQTAHVLEYPRGFVDGGDLIANSHRQVTSGWYGYCKHWHRLW